MNEGIHIGNDRIVGAHSRVEGDIDPYVIAIGQPAQQTAHRLKIKIKTQPLSGD